MNAVLKSISAADIHAYMQGVGQRARAASRAMARASTAAKDTALTAIAVAQFAATKPAVCKPKTPRTSQAGRAKGPGAAQCSTA